MSVPMGRVNKKFTDEEQPIGKEDVEKYNPVDPRTLRRQLCEYRRDDPVSATAMLVSACNFRQATQPEGGTYPTNL